MGTLLRPTKKREQALAKIAVWLALGVWAALWVGGAVQQGDYGRLARDGTRLSGQVVSSFRAGGVNQRRAVRLQYLDPNGRARKLTETWSGTQPVAPGSTVEIYYLSSNRFVKAASVRHPAIVRAVRAAQARAVGSGGA